MDAQNVLTFMASNGLVANKSKTEFLVLNHKPDSAIDLGNISVGGATVSRTSHTKLFGIIIEESQEWSQHLKSLQSSLNARLFIIRRIKQQIPESKLIQIVHSLWICKLRYGLQLCIKVRLTNEDPITADLKALQATQNRMLRMINNNRISDMVSSRSILEKFNLLSVNQTAASIKLVEVWKSFNQDGYPISFEPYNQNLHNHNRDLRPQANRLLKDNCRLKRNESSFSIDAARLWNAAPKEISEAPSIQTR